MQREKEIFLKGFEAGIEFSKLVGSKIEKEIKNVSVPMVHRGKPKIKKSFTRRGYTQGELELLKNSNLSVSDVAKMTDRTPSAIRTARYRLSEGIEPRIVGVKTDPYEGLAKLNQPLEDAN